MSTFSNSILSSFLLFPFVGLFFTIPYIFYQYHKYGSVNPYRSIIIYSFLLYLMTSYFLVILPLPSMEEVSKMTLPQYNLIPFHFIREIFSSTSFHVSDFATYFPTLKNSVVYEAIFNILLTLPFGIYLHYYFECDFKKTVFYTFLLSLFFELTQLTGLYFIYPRGYRVFDIDDLILNTFGGFLGYFVSKLFLLFLPHREEIDKKTIEKAKNASFMKKLLSFLSDAILISILLGCSFHFFFKSISFLYFIIYTIFIFIFYYVILSIQLKGSTPFMKYFHLQFTSSKKVSFFRLLLYYGLLFLEYFGLPLFFLYLGYLLEIHTNYASNFYEYYYIILCACTLMVYCITFLKMVLKMKTIPEMISKIWVESKIKG